jgi:hypothetical protein
MKRLLLFLILPLAALSAGCSDSGGDAPALRRLPVDGLLTTWKPYCGATQKGIEATEELAAEGTNVAVVYEVVDSRVVDYEYAVEMARRLGITMNPVENERLDFRLSFESDETYVKVFEAEDDRAQMDIEQATGDVGFFVKAQAEAADETADMPEEEAVRIASEFLESLDLPVPSEHSVPYFREYPGGIAVYWRSDFYLANRYTPRDATISVENDGSVSDLNYRWYELRAMGEYPLSSERDSLELIKRCEGRVEWFGGPLPPTVSEVRIEYVGLPVGGPYRYFVPAYHFGNELAEQESAYWGTPTPPLDITLDPNLATHAWIIAVESKYLKKP